MQVNMKTKNVRFRLTLYLVFLILSLNCNICSGENAISGDQYLSGDEILISKQSIFELGFFNPGKSSNFYIGIWYNQLVAYDGWDNRKQTIVWVANRETPVKDKYSSFLRIQGTNLVLFNESQVPIWSTNVDFIGSTPVVAIIQDDGNLVLTVKSSNLPIWESFDHPTDTWLPGAKLAYNKVTKRAHSFTSWKNSEDPAPGLFSLHPFVYNYGDDTYFNLTMTWNRTREYWTKGWNELNFICSYNINFSLVANVDEPYLTYYNRIDPEYACILVTDVSGQIKAIDGRSPREKCNVFSYCGEFGVCDEYAETICNCLVGFEPKSDEYWSLDDFSGGCKRTTNLQCVNGRPEGNQDEFNVYRNMNAPENDQSLSVGSVAECESRCLNNCSCTAYAYDDSRCSIWHGNLLNLIPSGSTPVFIRVAASEFSSGKNKSATVIGAVLGCVAVVFVLLGIILRVFWRRNRRMRVVGAAEASLAVFGYRDLHNATKNFSHKLGAGGFGSVFRGSLPDSSVVAVKKLETVSQGEKQFRAEVSTIGTKQHINLVRLCGFCSQGTNRLLVYEYLENRSLDWHLFRGDESIFLDWKKRYQIALGTARGLAYLHEKCREVIIHCDIKPENILLDADFCPKVADFGLAKLMGRNFSRVLTTMRGTRGYLAPEWLSGVAITPKADVYSYGMMAFELISGKRNAEFSEEGLVRFFPSIAAEVMANEGDMMSLLDPRLDKQGDVEEVSRLCKVACWCIQDAETHRPSMGQVVQILEQVLDVNVPPIPWALRTLKDSQDRVVFFTKSSTNRSVSE